MNRRGFLHSLVVGATAVVVAPYVKLATFLAPDSSTFTPTEAQKVDMVKRLIQNGLEAHERQLDECLRRHFYES